MTSVKSQTVFGVDLKLGEDFSSFNSTFIQLFGMGFPCPLNTIPETSWRQLGIDHGKGICGGLPRSVHQGWECALLTQRRGRFKVSITLKDCICICYFCWELKTPGPRGCDELWSLWDGMTAKPRPWEVNLLKGSAFLGPQTSQVLLDRTWKHFCSPLLPLCLHHWCQLHLLVCLALDLGLTKTFLYIVFIFSHCQGALCVNRISQCQS